MFDLRKLFPIQALLMLESPTINNENYEEGTSKYEFYNFVKCLRFQYLLQKNLAINTSLCCTNCHCILCTIDKKENISRR